MIGGEQGRFISAHAPELAERDTPPQILRVSPLLGSFVSGRP